MYVDAKYACENSKDASHSDRKILHVRLTCMTKRREIDAFLRKMFQTFVLLFQPQWNWVVQFFPPMGKNV